MTNQPPTGAPARPADVDTGFWLWLIALPLMVIGYLADAFFVRANERVRISDHRSCLNDRTLEFRQIAYQRIADSINCIIHVRHCPVHVSQQRIDGIDGRIRAPRQG